MLVSAKFPCDDPMARQDLTLWQVLASAYDAAPPNVALLLFQVSYVGLHVKVPCFAFAFLWCCGGIHVQSQVMSCL